ncbi:TIR domain-containing protein [Aquiflexum gelatinilyticum]|uniref:TIR domain-containing protein n=1 Tax=Aquiflexum gelatinilyticum TaxID=2961943 RepID=UPI00216A264F|nr:TIR domain-containing protein [Aquiflexum gelatinilyticum]MCS4432871.1 TIR domain-containing protein [Aquiflexum gelatinilyticum]
MESSIFLSYSRDDYKSVQQIQTLLREKGIMVWIDQESIYAGENWPKAIGEGIAKQSKFMLLWSKHAAKSHFVEFEWNTALALKKKIIPVLLDTTPLPPTLISIQAIEYALLSNSLHFIKKKLDQIVPHQIYSQQEVLDKLDEIKENSPMAVLAKAKMIYKQEGWTIQGNVYQVNGENITIHHPLNSSEKNKKWYELWQTYIALIAGTLGILVILIDIPKKWREAFPLETEEVIASISVKGIIYNEENQPIVGAIIKIDKLPGESTITTNEGGFIFNDVPGEAGDAVRVYVEASGYESRNEYKTLPGPIEMHLKKEVPIN